MMDLNLNNKTKTIFLALIAVMIFAVSISSASAANYYNLDEVGSNPTTMFTNETEQFTYKYTENYGATPINSASIVFYSNNGVPYTTNVTNAQGIVTFNFRPSSPGTYAIHAQVNPTGPWTPVKYLVVTNKPVTPPTPGNNSTPVNPPTPVNPSTPGSHGQGGAIRTFIKIDAPTIQTGQKTDITITVTAADRTYIAYQKVKITLNGKTYTKTTNAKGAIKLKVSGLKAGKYKITAVYAGNTTYGASNASKNQLVVGRHASGGLADLKITKVKRAGNSYKVTIKNQGTVRSMKFNLQIWCGCKKYQKKIVVGPISAKKSVTKTVKFFKFANTKHHIKYAKVNANKYALESNYKNNYYKIGRWV